MKTLIFAIAIANSNSMSSLWKPSQIHSPTMLPHTSGNNATHNSIPTWRTNILLVILETSIKKKTSGRRRMAKRKEKMTRGSLHGRHPRCRTVQLPSAIPTQLLSPAISQTFQNNFNAVWFSPAHRLFSADVAMNEFGTFFLSLVRYICDFS